MKSWVNIEPQILKRLSVWLRSLQHISVILDKDADYDCLSAGVGLSDWLESQGKIVQMVGDKPVPEELADLKSVPAHQKPTDSEWKKNTHPQQPKQAISLAPLDYISSDSQNPAEASGHALLSRSHGLIILGADEPEQLGNIFTDQIEWLESLPKAGIYSKIGLEPFVQLPILDPTASGLSQVVAEVTHSLDPGSLTPHAATALYTGLASATRNFHRANVTSSVFTCAAWLLAKGAILEQVTKILYPKQSLESLKFFGTAVSRLVKLSHMNAGLAVVPTQSTKAQLSTQELCFTASNLLWWLEDCHVILLAYEKTPGTWQLIVNFHPLFVISHFLKALPITQSETADTALYRFSSGQMQFLENGIDRQLILALEAGFGIA